MGWYFGGVPTVNPSVTAAPCQLPQAGSLWGAATKPPWPLWGCLGTAEAGGFRGKSHGLLPYSLFTFP